MQTPLNAFGRNRSDVGSRTAAAWRRTMGNFFRREDKNGKESSIWRMKYRVWEPRASDWGKYKFESTGTANRREAESILLERERREERRRTGLEIVAPERVGLRRALSEFLDAT